MTKWREFLVEHAKFPFPHPVENKAACSTDISLEDVGRVDPKWRAKYAVPDETLVQNLCRTLDNILEDTIFPDDIRADLLLKFGRHLQFLTFGPREMEDRTWSTNRNEYESRMILDKGFFPAAAFCLEAYGGYLFTNTVEHVERGLSKVDYLGMVDDKRVVLVEAKSPSVMKAVGDSLPEHTVELNWTPGGDLVSRVLLKAALYLGLREMEWLFLTCHNSWIICRLVSDNDNDNPFLAFSRIFSIEGSSQPFRAFMGAILSVLNGVPVQASEFHPAVALDTIPEGGEGGPSSSPKDIDGSGEYRGRSTANISSTRPITRSRATASHDAVESELMFTLSFPHYPESFQVWAHLHSLPNNAFALPHCAENGNEKRRLWLTRHIGSGSTGNVWECHFDNGDDLFAIKVVKLRRLSDVECQRRFYNEFEVYLSLEIAYQSGQLRDRISPHCYGAFEGDGTGVLILGLCGDTLKDWDELNFSEQTQVYGLVWDLHRLGIIHGDLEPRNIARVPGGGFRLIDFSESVRHTCVEMSVRHMVTPFT
ncbi:hypothetical protein EDB92DRAFT_1810674 [Lactarius akahatsu]|uniref:Protein kinase domain-containing protein n=1 Tax=Lactarius akahatsu TaxID=416441 RepID=A0AAD4L561_9AGAM|nr:hypothetical protein EDB92DRAFT_1810674 [Lactarius akahatsu]